jgi:hypothetical protein
VTQCDGKLGSSCGGGGEHILHGVVKRDYWKSGTYTSWRGGKGGVKDWNINDTVWFEKRVAEHICHGMLEKRVVEHICHGILEKRVVEHICHGVVEKRVVEYICYGVVETE